jgi:hypothetical protein
MSMVAEGIVAGSDEDFNSEEPCLGHSVEYVVCVKAARPVVSMATTRVTSRMHQNKLGVVDESGVRVWPPKAGARLPVQPRWFHRGTRTR